MELDLSDLHINPQSGVWITLAAVLGVLLVGLLGWFVSPDGQLLTPTEWQVYKQHNQYQQELRTLTRHADRLAELLKMPPDPVRAQLVSEQMEHDLERNVNLAALADPESALLTAGDAMLTWSLGTASKNDAISALDMANQSIERAMDQIQIRGGQ